MRFPATLSIKPSRRLRAALAFVHLAAAGGLCFLLSPGFAAGIAGLLAVSYFRYARAAAFRAVALTLGEDGMVEYRQADGSVLKAEMLPDSTNFGWLVVLRYRVVGEKRVQSVIVLGDSLSAQEQRQLQIWMRWILPFRRASAAG